VAGKWAFVLCHDLHMMKPKKMMNEIRRLMEDGAGFAVVVHLTTAESV